MKINKSKFQSAVHLGLLVIICILLFVNFRSNLTIYHAGVAKRKDITVDLNKVALSVGRTVQKENITSFDKPLRETLLQKHGLTRLILISEPSGKTASRPLDQLVREAGDSVFSYQHANVRQESFPPVKELFRDDSHEYYYLFPLFGGTKLLVLAKAVPELAYLEDSSETLIIVNIVAVVLIVILYMLLFRVILSPFKKLRSQAASAGRDLPGEFDDIEVMLDDYRQIIDELKEKEAQLLQLNHSIQARADRLELFNEYLLRSISSGIIIIDAEGRILSINRAASRIMGIDPELFVGKNYSDIPSFCRVAFETVRNMLETGKTQSYRECDVKGRDSQNLTLGVTVSSIHDYASNPVGVSILINDLTEIKQLRSEIEARNRLAALGEMAGGLAHQLRNSIGAMAGYAHLVKKRMQENDLRLESINALEDEAREAERLVERFLNFARPFDFSPETADVGQMLDDLLETFRVRPEYRHVNFVSRSQLPAHLRANIDTLLVKQALANIIENAVNSYDGKEGTVELSVSEHSGYVEITTKDFGCGIMKENIDKIFTPFYSSRPSGTGLGLPLAKKIIDLHQGRLTVASEPDRGTMFTVFLPRDAHIPATRRTELSGLKA